MRCEFGRLWRGSLMRCPVVGALCVSATLAGAVIYAQQPVPAVAAEKPAEPKYTIVKIENADKVGHRWAEKVTILTGNVVLTQGDVRLAADKVEYMEATSTAVASGSLRISDDRSAITGDSCTVNFKEKRASVDGKVTIVTKPKSAPNPDDKALKSKLKTETTIVCDGVVYYYKEKRAVISTPVTITQPGRKVTANSATYVGADEVITLVGNVTAVDDDSRNTLTAGSAKISVRDADQWMETEKTQGVFYIKDDSEEKKAEPSPAKPAAPAQQPPTDAPSTAAPPK